MLEAVPQNAFSQNYVILDNGMMVTTIHFAWFREASEMMIEDVPYKAYREGGIRGVFVFERDDGVLARCKKPSVWSRTLLVDYKDTQYILNPASMWGRGYAVMSGDQVVGTIKPKSMGSRKASIDLPVELPLAVRVFLIWLVLVMWKRAADSSAGAS